MKLYRDDVKLESIKEKSSDNIAAHNASIFEKIHMCTNKKEKYQNLKKNSENIIFEIRYFIDDLTKCNNLLDNIIINNRPVGNNELLNTSNYAQKMEIMFLNIVAVCNKKILDTDEEIVTLKGQLW